MIIVAFAVAFYMAWNIGANDLANSMGDVVGSKALTLRQVVLSAGILSFLGATLLGLRVAKKVGWELVPIEQIKQVDPILVTIGVLSALLAAGIWITLATYLHLPVSTTHSIVGAMLGFGISCVLTNVIELGDIGWGVILRAIVAWILSPVAGMCMSYLIYRIIRYLFIDRTADIAKLEGIFRWFVIASSCYQAFAFGSNDIANAVGPIAALMMPTGEGMPIWVLAFGGVGIALGLATWGYRVVWTVGKRITELTPTRGFSADIGCATAVLICSSLGMPVSTTHVLVGSTIGVGLARGLDAVNLRVVRDITYIWIATVPIAAGISIVVYLGLVGMLGI
jgi:PiT family inorganic phosphate transporter